MCMSCKVFGYTVKIDCKTGHAFLFNGEYR